MPANLGPEYLAAEEEFRAAETPSARIAALEKMLATLPKHKGTEKMQADLKKRLSQARKDSQKKGPAHSTPFYFVPREGTGQVALIGPANSGKSTLLRALTHARPEVAEYPFTTRLPLPGMMNFENVQIQLLDLPAVDPGYTEPWLPQAVRNATATVLVVDVNDPRTLDGIDYVESSLQAWKAPVPALLVGNHIDRDGGPENFAALQELFGDRYRSVAISAETGEGLDRFAREVFDLLQLVRVYTKAPGKKPELTSPYVLKRGATVEDAARHVHKDFAEQFKFARLFRRAGQHDGMMVERHHVVDDEDILEFHI